MQIIGFFENNERKDEELVLKWFTMHIYMYIW